MVEVPSLKQPLLIAYILAGFEIEISPLVTLKTKEFTMSQKSTVKIIQLLIIQVLFLAALSACSKTPSGVRPQIKNQQNDLNQQQSVTASQNAAAINANYSIATISVPENTTAGVAVKVELASPNGQYLPLRTVHEGSVTDSSGIYNDNQRGVQVQIESRCSNTIDCNKYILLVTVIKDGQAVFQTFAISYKDDCRFNVVSASPGNGTIYRDISSAEVARSNVIAAHDIDTCPQ